MSTASLAHAQQEPTPIHPVTEPCAHDWHISDYVIDTFPETRFRKCARCAAEEQTNLSGEWEPRQPRLPSASPATAPQPMPLTATERSAFLGLQAQARQYEQAINEQERAIVAEIEARLGLDVGAIGVSHTVNAQTWQVVAMPQQDGEEAAASQR